MKYNMESQVKYNIQNKASGKWMESYKWDTDHWVIIWNDDRAKAVLLDRTLIGTLIDALKDCTAFRGEWADRRAPDGVVSMGKRLVRKNGVVSFAGCKYRHNKLVPFEGKHIFVEADGYWIVNPHAFKTSLGFIDHDNHICDLEFVK